MKRAQVQRELGRRLFDARRRRRMTQQQVADRARMSRNNVSMLERGVHTPDLWSLLCLAEALQVEPDTLIAREWKPPQEQP